MSVGSPSVCVISHKPFYPVVSGHALTIYNALAGLVQRGFRVYFYCYEKNQRRFGLDGVSVNHVAFPRLARAILQSDFFRRLAQLLRSAEASLSLIAFNPKLLNSARARILSCDAVLAEHAWGALIPLIFCKVAGKRSVLVDHNVEVLLSLSLLRLRLSYLVKALLFCRLVYTVALEKLACSLASRIVVVSPVDKQRLCHILRINPRKVTVIPNSVDPLVMRDRPDVRGPTRARLGIPADAFVILFVGDLTTLPNFLALKQIADNIAPKVISRNARAWFLIVGQYQNSTGIGAPPDRVVFTNVVDDVQPYLSAADICIAPMEVGSGTRLKILTYLAFSKPTVSTEIGVEGISAKHGVHLIVSDLGSFPDAILELMGNPQVRSRLGTAARQLILDQYDRDVVSEQLANLLRTVQRK